MLIMLEKIAITTIIFRLAVLTKLHKRLCVHVQAFHFYYYCLFFVSKYYV